MDPANSVKVSRDSTYSGASRKVNTISPTGLSPSVVTPFQTYSAIVLLVNFTMTGPITPVGISNRFGLFRFRSPLLTESIFLSLPVGT